MLIENPVYYISAITQCIMAETPLPRVFFDDLGASLGTTLYYRLGRPFGSF